jgi:hypothetical protein
VTEFIGPGSVMGDHLAAGSVGSTDLADGAVGTDQLADGGVTEPKLASGVVPKFLSLSVFGANLGSGASCTISLRPNYLSVAQVGKAHPTGLSVATGFTVVGGEVLTAPSIANHSTETLVTIESPDPAAPLQPGDAVNFGFFRSGSVPSDTCAQDTVIQGLWIEYV